MAKIHWLHTAIGRVYRIALRCTPPLGGAQRLQQYPQSIRQFDRAQLKRSAVRDKGPDGRHQSSCAMAVRSFPAGFGRSRTARSCAARRSTAQREASPSTRRRTWEPAVAAPGCTSRTAASALSTATGPVDRRCSDAWRRQLGTVLGLGRSQGFGRSKL